MMKSVDRILIIGQCTLHWGRMEYGNIGNYYIIAPFFKELRRVFPHSEIATTMQFSDCFCKHYNIETLPMDVYYDFNRNDNLCIAKAEYAAVTHNRSIESRYIDEVKKASVVIDFSGDIWGDNADFIGKDRFATGCFKDLIAQYLKPTAMLAGSPGPFGKVKNLALAKKTYSGFDLVTNREPVSTKILNDLGFDVSKTMDCPCPSFLFPKATDDVVASFFNRDIFNVKNKLKIGFILCGWNFKKGPFDRWPRDVNEYDQFVELIKAINDKYDANIFLLSHSNGFKVPPEKFELIHGRDYPIMEQLFELLCENGQEQNITLLNGIYPPDVTKGIISHFDILISGRMHGAVAGLSQSIPTMIIDYGHEPKAHKLRGFAKVVGMENFIANPNDFNELKNKAFSCIDERYQISIILKDKMSEIEKQAKNQFDMILQI